MVSQGTGEAGEPECRLEDAPLPLQTPAGRDGFVLLPQPCLSSCHRIPAWQGLAGPSVGPPAQPPAEAGSPRAGGTAPRPGVS